MRNVISLVILCALYAFLQPFAQAQTIRLSEPVTTNELTETFGTQLNTQLPKVTMVELLKTPSDYVGAQFQLETKIAKVCQKKGCFFIAQQNEHTLRVSFKDYGFFIPTNSSGKTVVMNGELIQKQMSDEQAEHFNSDLQSKTVIKPGIVYEIVATSIMIPLA